MTISEKIELQYAVKGFEESKRRTDAIRKAILDIPIFWQVNIRVNAKQAFAQINAVKAQLRGLQAVARAPLPTTATLPAPFKKLPKVGRKGERLEIPVVPAVEGKPVTLEEMGIFPSAETELAQWNKEFETSYRAASKNVERVVKSEQDRLRKVFTPQELPELVRPPARPIKLPPEFVETAEIRPITPAEVPRPPLEQIKSFESEYSNAIIRSSDRIGRTIRTHQPPAWGQIFGRRPAPIRPPEIQLPEFPSEPIQQAEQFSSALGRTRESLSRVEDQNRRTTSSVQGLGREIQKSGRSSISASRHYFQLAFSAHIIGIQVAIATAAIASLSAAMISSFAEFDKAYYSYLAKVEDMADAISQPRIWEMARDQIYGSAQLAKVAERYAASGVDVANSSYAIVTAARLATISEDDLGKTTEGLVTIMHAYGLALSEVNRLSDILVNTADASTAEVKDMTRWFGQAAAVAKMAGVEVRSLGLLLGVLSSTGIREAGIYLRSLLKDIQTEAKAKHLAEAFSIDPAKITGDFDEFIRAARKRIKEIPKELREPWLREILIKSKIDQRAQVALISLLTAQESLWLKIETDLDKVGSVEQKYDIYTQSLAGTIEILMGNLQQMTEIVGKSLVPVLKVLNDVVSLSTTLFVQLAKIPLVTEAIGWSVALAAVAGTFGMVYFFAKSSIPVIIGWLIEGGVVSADLVDKLGALNAILISQGRITAAQATFGSRMLAIRTALGMATEAEIIQSRKKFLEDQKILFSMGKISSEAYLTSVRQVKAASEATEAFRRRGASSLAVLGIERALGEEERREISSLESLIDAQLGRVDSTRKTTAAQTLLTLGTDRHRTAALNAAKANRGLAFSSILTAFQTGNLAEAITLLVAKLVAFKIYLDSQLILGLVRFRTILLSLKHVGIAGIIGMITGGLTEEPLIGVALATIYLAGVVTSKAREIGIGFEEIATAINKGIELGKKFAKTGELPGGVSEFLASLLPPEHRLGRRLPTYIRPRVAPIVSKRPEVLRTALEVAGLEPITEIKRRRGIPPLVAPPPVTLPRPEALRAPIELVSPAPGETWREYEEKVRAATEHQRGVMAQASVVAAERGRLASNAIEAERKNIGALREALERTKAQQEKSLRRYAEEAAEARRQRKIRADLNRFHAERFSRMKAAAREQEELQKRIILSRFHEEQFSRMKAAAKEQEKIQKRYITQAELSYFYQEKHRRMLGAAQKERERWHRTELEAVNLDEEGLRLLRRRRTQEEMSLIAMSDTLKRNAEQTRRQKEEFTRYARGRRARTYFAKAREVRGAALLSEQERLKILEEGLVAEGIFSREEVKQLTREKDARRRVQGISRALREKRSVALEKRLAAQRSIWALIGREARFEAMEIGAPLKRAMERRVPRKRIVPRVPKIPAEEIYFGGGLIPVLRPGALRENIKLIKEMMSKAKGDLLRSWDDFWLSIEGRLPRRVDKFITNTGEALSTGLNRIVEKFRRLAGAPLPLPELQPISRLRPKIGLARLGRTPLERLAPPPKLPRLTRFEILPAIRAGAEEERKSRLSLTKEIFAQRLLSFKEERKLHLERARALMRDRMRSEISGLSLIDRVKRRLARGRLTARLAEEFLALKLIHATRQRDRLEEVAVATSAEMAGIKLTRLERLKGRLLEMIPLGWRRKGRGIGGMLKGLPSAALGAATRGWSSFIGALSKARMIISGLILIIPTLISALISLAPYLLIIIGVVMVLAWVWKKMGERSKEATKLIREQSYAIDLANQSQKKANEVLQETIELLREQGLERQAQELQNLKYSESFKSAVESENKAVLIQEILKRRESVETWYQKAKSATKGQKELLRLQEVYQKQVWYLELLMAEATKNLEGRKRGWTIEEIKERDKLMGQTEEWVKGWWQIIYGGIFGPEALAKKRKKELEKATTIGAEIGGKVYKGEELEAKLRELGFVPAAETPKGREETRIDVNLNYGAVLSERISIGTEQGVIG